MQANEVITFDKGLSTKKSPLLLEDGELVTAQGMSYDVFGAIQPRSSKQKVSATQLGTINGLHRNVNTVMLSENDNLRYKWDLDGFCDLYVPANGDFTVAGVLNSSNRPVFCDHESFTFVVTGNDKKVFSGSNFYEWDINPPSQKPIGTAGSAGNPNGTYSLYYTYLITFPNGTVVETAPSPAGSVTVSSQAITWSGITPCLYVGTGLTIHRKLYRYSTTLIEIYYVATIGDNTTTTYTDDFTDAQLEINSILETVDYVIPPPNPTFIASHLQRMFCVEGSYIYPSEPYLPFSFDWSSVLQVTQLGDDLQCAIKWGDQLYLPTKNTWYRLHGSSSDSWQIKQSFAHNGVLNKHTVKASRYGIFGLWTDGIYLFDGNVSKNITLQKVGKALFDGISDRDSCYSEWDGRKYYFHYPESGTTLSKRLVIDMGSYPEIVVYNDDFIPTAHYYDPETTINYYGFNGYHYEEGGADVVSFSMKTGDRAAKNLMKHKQLEYFFYDINTGGKDVTVSIYIDDESAFTKTINTSERTKERVQLPQKSGYRFSVEVTAADARGITIYEPWAVSVNLTGE
jgi:hypothetical protein